MKLPYFEPGTVSGTLLAVGVSLLAAWLALVVFLMLARPKGIRLQEAMRLIPDVLRLTARLAADRSLPRGVRIRLALLAAYLASPIDLIPDILPVIGQVDDAIIASAVLRSVVRAAGPEAIRRHWPGTPAGLSVLWRVARLPGSPDSVCGNAPN